MAEKIIRRKDALAQGLKRYFTGKPCKRGHIADRFTSQGDCIVCSDENNKRKPWHKVHPERARTLARERARQYSAEGRRQFQTDPEKNKERCKARYHADPERSKAEWLARPNRKQLLEEARERTRQWELDNPEQAKLNHAVQAHRRRARKRQAGGSHTRADIQRILEAQNFLCVYCPADLREVKRHLDHIQPISRGGSNNKENLQWLCASCNQSKHAHDHNSFLKLFFLSQ